MLVDVEFIFIKAIIGCITKDSSDLCILTMINKSTSSHLITFIKSGVMGNLSISFMMADIFA